MFATYAMQIVSFKNLPDCFLYVNKCNAYDKLKAMEQCLAKGKQIQDDGFVVIKKLRAMLHSSEEQLRVHKKQTVFLTQLYCENPPQRSPLHSSEAFHVVLLTGFQSTTVFE